MIGTDPDEKPAGSRAPAIPTERYRLVLGFERIGLIALRTPIMSALIVAAICIFAAFGVAKLKVDDSLSSLFRSDTPEFHQFEDLSRRFPSHEYDVLMVVEGDGLLDRENIDKLRDVVTDVQLISGARGVLSMFSAREAPQAGHSPGPLFPADLPEGDEYKALIDRALSNDLIRGKLLSEDGKLALVVIALDPAVADSEKVGDVVGSIRKTIADDMQGSDLKAELSGVPVMRLEIRNAVERDRAPLQRHRFRRRLHDRDHLLPAAYPS